MPSLQLICCPYQDGRRDFGMGAGAAFLGADNVLRAGLQADGWSVRAETVLPVDERRSEIARTMEVIRRLAARVRSAAAAEAFPLVLAPKGPAFIG
jgi:hypothetical protein